MRVNLRAEKVRGCFAFFDRLSEAEESFVSLVRVLLGVSCQVLHDLEVLSHVVGKIRHVANFRYEMDLSLHLKMSEY